MRVRQYAQAVMLTLGALGLVTACAAPPAVPTANPNAPTVLIPLTSSPQTPVLPTLLPTVVVAPTQPPPTPVPVIPTITPIPITATPEAPTRPRATNSPVPPAETATPLPEGTPKVFVTAIRVDPATPKANTPGTFFVTFQNNSGENQAHRWAVEIWRAEEERPFGLTAPEASPMPTGTSTHTSSGWAPRGQGECVAYRAKIVGLDENNNRTDFIRPDGTILWFDFTVCP